MKKLKLSKLVGESRFPIEPLWYYLGVHAGGIFENDNFQDYQYTFRNLGRIAEKLGEIILKGSHD